MPVRKSNVVPAYFPTISSDPLASTFVKYCKLFLIKYNPWSDNVCNAWNNIEDDQQIIIYWNGVVQQMRDQGLPIPDHVRRQIVEFNALQDVVLPDTTFDLPTNEQFDADDVNEFNDDDNDVQVQIELNN